MYVLGAPAWPRVCHQRGPLPRLRFSVRRRAPGRGLRTLAQPPARLAGGLPGRICPVEPFSIVPRRLAGGCAPRLPGGGVTEKRILGGWGHGKAHSARHGSRRLRLSVRRRAGMRLSVSPHARPSLAAHGSSQPGTGPQGRRRLGPVSSGLRKRREVRVMGPFPPYVRSQKWNWLLPSA